MQIRLGLEFSSPVFSTRRNLLRHSAAKHSNKSVMERRNAARWRRLRRAINPLKHPCRACMRVRVNFMRVFASRASADAQALVKSPQQQGGVCDESIPAAQRAGGVRRVRVRRRDTARSFLTRDARTPPAFDEHVYSAATIAARGL
jgi:hypothetical protein